MRVGPLTLTSPEAASRRLPGGRFAGRRRWAWAAAAIPLTIVLGCSGLALRLAQDPSTALVHLGRRLPAQAIREPERLVVTGAGVLVPVSASEAQRLNAALPLSSEPIVPARPFTLPPAQGADRERAVDCLADAIYYEADGEPLDGRRAVAQVVLNRVRHPAFPHTVCGVVYEGADRSSGCQFSFTCDGSLARPRRPAGWQQARQIALRAVAGAVYAPVGLSAFYHADYVLPFWGPRLVKVMTVGRHIFYRWDGTWGRPGSFQVRYAGGEPDIAGRPAPGAGGPAAINVAASGSAVAIPSARPILTAAPAAPRPAASPTVAGGPRWILMTAHDDGARATARDSTADRAENRAVASF